MLQKGISGEGPNVELNGMKSASKIGLNQIVKGFFSNSYYYDYFVKMIHG